MICKICSNATAPFAEARLLDKYEIAFFQCGNCGFTQSETPYWLEEAYLNAVNDTDIGLVGRNIALSTTAKAIIFAFFDRDAKFIDYGGGYGLFVRIMRDLGFDFYRSDKFCPNLFVKEFEAEAEGKQQYELVTAFEVFEHLVNPPSEIDRILSFSRNILFSTLLIPPHNPKPDEWWYYGLDHGQHVSLYTLKSLSVIAQRFHLNLYTNGTFLHLLTERKLSLLLFKLVSRYKVGRLIDVLWKKDSLLADDYFKMTGKKLN